MNDEPATLTAEAAEAAEAVGAVGAPEPPVRSRRVALLAPAAALVAAACAPPTATTPTTTAPTTPTTTTPPPSGGGGSGGLTASLAVDKLTFGPRPGLVAEIEAMGVVAWIDAQLSMPGLPDAESLVAGPAFSTLRNSNADNYLVQNSDGGQDLLFDQLDHATLLRATRSSRQLYEVMCDFWANHFNIWRRHTWMGFLRTRDLEDVIRPNALGRFSDMLSASSHSPAMLDYLDNLPSDASTPGGVNQNYARELMELHTLGIVNGVKEYDENDVQAVAQILSGWSIDWSDGPTKFTFAYLPWQHSYTAVSCFGGAFHVPARSYGQGYADGLALIDHLAHHSATARYIATKLCRKFVADVPPAALVASTAAVFTANDTAIAPTLRHIFGSEEFAQSGRSKIRRPLDHLAGSLRALDATIGVDPQSDGAVALRTALDDMGQPIFERVSPDGYPDAAGFWVSSEGLLQRWAFSGELARNGLNGSSDTEPIRVSLPALLPTPVTGTVADLVGSLASRLANITLSTVDVGNLCTAAGITSTAAATTLSASSSKLALVVGLLLCHPSFQRR